MIWCTLHVYLRVSPASKALTYSNLVSTSRFGPFKTERDMPRSHRLSVWNRRVRSLCKPQLCLGLLLLSFLASTPVPPVSAITLSEPSVIQTPKQATVSPASVNMTAVGFGGERIVAFNATIPSNIVVTGTRIFDTAQYGFVHVTSDGGRTCRYGNASLSYIGSVIYDGWAFYDAVGTFDAKGDVYVGTLETGATSSSLVDYLFKSTDGGNSFLLTSPFLKMTDNLLDYQTGAIVHPCNNSPPFRDYPAVIADSYLSSHYRNNVYVLVRTSAEVSPGFCPFGVGFERSADGGQTWGFGVWFGGPYSGIPGDFALSDNRGMAVAPDGTVLLAGLGACYRSAGVPSNALVLRSADGGASFQKICANTTNLGLVHVEVAASSASTIYVVLYGANLTNNVDNLHLYSEVTRDGGSSWSPISRIDDVTTPDVTKVAFAYVNPMWDLSLSQQTGRLDLAWLDWRNNGGNYTLADIYYSYSYDARSWAPDIRVTSDGPYYICTQSAGRACTNTGNDFMWITSSYTPGSDKAYIVASMGKADCGPLCSALLTRFVTVTFPSPSLGTLMFFTDPSLNPLLLDDNGNPIVSVSLSRGVVVSTSPRLVMAWVNATNTGSAPLESLMLNETLPVDWTTSPRMPTRAAVHIYYASNTSQNTRLEITRPSTITVSAGNPETIILTVSNLTATLVGHPLMPGQSILVSVTLSYGLMGTSQTLLSYPRNYTDVATTIGWTQPYYTGITASATGSSFFTAYARVPADPAKAGNTGVLVLQKYTLV